MALNWNMYADTGQNLADGLGGLADLAGVSSKAKNRAALDQKFSSLASLGSPETGAMTGLPLEPQRDRLPAGPAPEQFAGNPKPQEFDGPLGTFSNKDLIDIMRNPEAQDTERALVMDEYKRRTTPKDPYAEQMKKLELELAQKKVQTYGQQDPLRPTTSMQEYELAQRDPKYAEFLNKRDTSRGTNVNVGGPIKLTEGQSKDLVYYNRGAGALERLEKVQGALTGAYDATMGTLPGIGNYLTSPEYQLANQAGREFLASILRKDTGAAVTADEVALYGATYLPQPGESVEVQNQKSQARREALEAIRNGLGTAEVLARTAPGAAGSAPQAPADGDPLAQARAAIAAGADPAAVAARLRQFGIDPSGL
jgi:hypothetical protein